MNQGTTRPCFAQFRPNNGALVAHFHRLARRLANVMDQRGAAIIGAVVAFLSFVADGS